MLLAILPTIFYIINTLYSIFFFFTSILYIYIFDKLIIRLINYIYTSSTARGGAGSFKKVKYI